MSDTDDQAWLLAIYQSAHSDTRWAKEQGWQAVTWSFALFSAVLALYRYPFAHAPLWPFVKLTIGIAILAGAYAGHQYQFAATSRATSDSIRGKMPSGVSDLLPHRGRDPNHVVYLYAQIAIILIAVVVTIFGLKWIHATSC